MQNAQNAAEIQQKVINLVELYRTKVGKECQIAKDLAAEYEAQYDQEIENARAMHEQGLGSYVFDVPIPEEEVDYIRVNEQLLGHFYKEVAGKDADLKALKNLLADKYDASVFSEEEESFLKKNFQTLVNYIIETPCNDLQATGGYDGKDVFLLPIEVIELIKKQVDIPSGAIVYNPFAGFGQFPIAYPECTFSCSEGFLSLRKEDEAKYLGTWIYAWLRVATFANQLKTEIGLPLRKEYDAVMSYLPKVQNHDYEIGDRITERIIEAYNHLKNGGKMILVCPNSLCWGISNYPEYEYGESPNGETVVLGKSWRGIQHAFRHAITSEGAIAEIIQLPQVMSTNADSKAYSILIIEKGRKKGGTTMIDARFASKESDRENFRKILDLKAFDAMMMNRGYDVETGLRKKVIVCASDLQEDLLIPQIYVVERPTDREHPVPLSTLCQLVTERVKDVTFDLPLDTPLVTATNLSTTFSGALDMKNVDKANCPNNPPHTDEYTFDKNGNFLDDPYDYFLGKGTVKGFQVAEYRQCRFLDGNKDAVLLAITKDSPQMALYRSSGKPIAVETDSILSNTNFYVFCTKDSIDALNLLAILRNPIVYRQLQAYERFGLYGPNGHLKDILVPTDKRIVNDEMDRLLLEHKTLKEKENELTSKKTEYINEVRMRKHDMRPHLRQLASSERLMLHYINNISNMDELKNTLKKQLEHSQSALANLSAIVEHLSDEEKFGESEMLNIDELLSDIEVNHDEGEGFVIEYDCDNGSFRNSGIKILNIAEQWEKARVHGLDMGIFLKNKAKEKLPLFINIATVDFQRLVTNIIENARRHGFTDKTRQDYFIGIELSYNSERGMYQIDFSNNGNPLPEGMTKSRYGIRGEKAGLAAGSGSGGHIVKSIVNNYGGDYDIFCKDGITTVRILLPIATI